MRGANHTTLILFWIIVLIITGVQIRAGASILPSCLLAIVLLTGGIEIPVAHKRMRKPDYTREAVHLLEEIYSVPLERDFHEKKRFFDTIITINLGGFVIPFVAACYLGVTSPNLASIEIGIIMIAVTHIVAVFQDGVGIKLPDYIGIVPLTLALLLASGETATVAFAAGVTGILIGLCTVLGAIDPERQGSARISIGGAGSFQAIYVTMCFAVLASLIA